jgi:FkbM family methyltransferase
MSTVYTVKNYHNGNSYFFETHDNCHVSNFIRRGEIWEPHMHRIFDHFIKSDMIVIEGGCHIGTHTLKLASLAKHVYAFEPLPKSNKVLSRNLALNKINNVTLSISGLSDKPGQTKFSWIPDGNPGGSGLDNNPMGRPNFMPKLTEEIKVDLTTIDEMNLEKLDFIKLDVEGYEELVIKGGMETIKRCRPVITLEMWSSHNGTVDMEFTTKKMKDIIDLNYKVVYVGGPDFLFIPN